jgi:hypothetical protein
LSLFFKAEGKLDKAPETYEQALEIYDAHEQSREDAKEFRAAWVAQEKAWRFEQHLLPSSAYPNLIQGPGP